MTEQQTKPQTLADAAAAALGCVQAQDRKRLRMQIAAELGLDDGSPLLSALKVHFHNTADHRGVVEVEGRKTTNTIWVTVGPQASEYAVVSPDYGRGNRTGYRGASFARALASAG